jgi:NAD(P)-dependent dehydrogenase (short-subunit alcohol dehydrogenase family)
MNLDKRVAIITGAAQRIGFAVAQRLAIAQASVVIVDINPEGVEEAAKKLRAIDASAKATGAVFDLSGGRATY